MLSVSVAVWTRVPLGAIAPYLNVGWVRGSAHTIRTCDTCMNNESFVGLLLQPLVIGDSARRPEVCATFAATHWEREREQEKEQAPNSGLGNVSSIGKSRTCLVTALAKVTK